MGQGVCPSAGGNMGEGGVEFLVKCISGPGAHPEQPARQPGDSVRGGGCECDLEDPS